MLGGPLYWSANHRHHHIFSDTDDDLHSPIKSSFLHSHCGWLFYKKNLKANYNLVRDYKKYSEIKFIDKHSYLPVICFVFVLYLIGGYDYIVWGFCLPAFFIVNAMLLVNSLTHIQGSRRFDIKDSSRNNWIVAIITFGEGWHNNHHRYAGLARQSIVWYEINLTYYLLIFLSFFKIVWGIKSYPKRLLIETKL